MHYALNELSFPISLKLGIGEKSGPYVLAGGEFSCIVSSVVEVGGVEIHPPPWPDPPKMKRFYPGLVFGGGFGFNIGRGSFFVESRYHLGLINVVRSSPESIKPRSIVLLIGMDFR
jgi:hypothetical protein